MVQARFIWQRAKALWCHVAHPPSALHKEGGGYRCQICFTYAAAPWAVHPEIARCDRELAEIRNRPEVVAGTAPAWLVTLGETDWMVERQLIRAEIGERR